MQHIYELADLYANEIIQSPDFVRLLELKQWIKQNLSRQIIGFKTAEAKYVEAKQYGEHHPNLKEYQEAFVLAKSKLYKEEAVKEYLFLETKIQRKLDEDFNALKKTISNKFKLDFFEKTLLTK